MGADALQVNVNDASLYVLDIDSSLLGKYTFNAGGNAGKDTSPDGVNDGTLVGDAAYIKDDPLRDEVLLLDGAATPWK